MKRIPPALFLLPFLIIISCKQKIDYSPIGAFKYEITNDSLFQNRSSLKPESFGYAIGSLNFECCGIKIPGTDSLDKNQDYIVAMKPVEWVKEGDDGQGHITKQALDIKLKDIAVTDSLYIYCLKPKGKYRLLLP